jgi:TATA-binding protein-associated factor
MSRLGLDFLDTVGDELDIEKDLAGDDLDVDMELTPPPPTSEPDIKMEDASVPSPLEPPSASSTTGQGSSSAPSPTEAEIDMSNMSAREMNRLKRKRKLGNSAFVSAPPPTQTNGAKFNVSAVGNKFVFF